MKYFILTSLLLLSLLRQAIAATPGIRLPVESAEEDTTRRNKPLKNLVEENQGPAGDGFIVGGTLAAQGEFPSFVLGNGCGGNLIHPDIVLTAAHCQGAFNSRVLVGAMKVGSTTSGAQWRNIVAGTMRPHPSYANTDKYDLMIFKIQTSTKVPSVINRDAGNPIAGQSLRVIGFGLTTEGGSASSSLRKVTVPAVSHSTCNQQYSGEIDETSEFCAGVSGKDSCQGDSGGPIFDASGKQVGVVSWGYGCAQANYPGVYSRVSGALSWIDQQICALSSVPPASCFAAAPVAAPTTPVAAPIAPVVAPTAPVAAPIAPVAAPTAPVAAPITPVAAPTSVTAPTVTYVTVTASVQYDAYPEEFGWKIIDGTTGKTIVNYPAKTFTADYKFLSGTVSLIKGRTYRLVMTDTIGDGICCAYGNGYVEIYAGNFYYVSIWGNIGKSYSMSFIA